MAKKTETKKQTKAEIYKIRYQIYRDLGYSAKEAQKLRSKALDVSNIKIKSDGQVPVHSKEYKRVKTDVKINTNFVKYKDKVDNAINDTVYSKWGMFTNDKRYKDDTAKMAKMIGKQHNLSNDQSYFFVYMMLQYNMSYDTAKKELLSSKEFEMYDKNKKMRGK